MVFIFISLWTMISAAESLIFFIFLILLWQSGEAERLLGTIYINI